MLTPNGLKVLNALGIYEPLKTRGYNYDYVYFQDATTKRVVETIEHGNLERYGVRSLRIYGYIVLEQLLAAAAEKSIAIHFGRAFDRIISESENEVTWRFTDGSTATASLLIGADGIHSAVRTYLHPGLKPSFNSAAGIIAAVPTAQLGLSEQNLIDLNDQHNEWPLPSGIMVPGLGGFVIAAQTYNGDEVMITVQRSMNETAEAKWAEINVDKDCLRSLFRQNSDQFPAIVQNAVRNIPGDQLFVWPFYHIPRLDHWTSAKTPGGFGRVVIMGDSAHALPPGAGQGANQALEDAYVFAGIVARLIASTGAPSNAQLQEALLGWQKFRQERVDQVVEINKQMNIRRMPKAAGVSCTSDEGKLDMGTMFNWLFNIDFEKTIEEFASSTTFIPASKRSSCGAPHRAMLVRPSS